MNSIADIVDPNTSRRQLSSQVNVPLGSLDKTAQSVVLQQAADDCLLICSAIAPGSGQLLLESLSTLSQEKTKNDPPGDMVILMVAYRNACTKNVKKQILSLYAYRYPVKTLIEIHEPYGKLTTWEIKQARKHANTYGAGSAPSVPKKKNRVRLDMVKVDHFLDFVNRPYFYQDVSYGTKVLTLDSGEKIEMPNVVRTMTRSTMIEQYLEYCKNDNCVPLSRSTLFNILDVREASQRKSLQGLDNSAANGAAGFQNLETIINAMEKEGMNKEWCCNVQRRLRSTKKYLKTDYRVHCKEEYSTCGDHCRHLALSDPGDPDFRQRCTHRHTQTCGECEDLKLVLSEIKNEIQGSSWSPYSDDHRDDLMYDFEQAQSDIFLWKAHIVRSINQERAKQDILQKEDSNAALIIMDWAMKFLQLRYRERQSDWFGKRGLSWHISTVISLDGASGNLELKSCAHLFDSCSQDWFAVCSIIENTLKTVKVDKPNITSVYLRSEEAGCYHNNFLIAAIRDIAQDVGLNIVQYDYSEPQYRKDVCDRILCPMKSCIRRCCNEGHDVLTAKDMYTALSSRPVRGTSASVCSVDERNKTLQVKKIDSFSHYHNFKYERNGVRVWKAYGVGNGKLILYKNLITKHQSSTDLDVNINFFPFEKARVYSSSKHGVDNQEHEGLFPCSEPGCQKVYKEFADLESHMDVGDHTGKIPLSNRNVYDKLRRDWAMQFLTVSKGDSSQGQDSTRKEHAHCGESTKELCADKGLDEGWALHKPRTGKARFSPKVKEYLTTKFDLGEKTGRKSDPAQVSGDMRTAKKNRRFKTFRQNRVAHKKSNSTGSEWGGPDIS